MSSGKILVIRGGAIGDFILTLPVLSALRTHLPGARLEVLGYPHIASLAIAGGLADGMKPIDARPLAYFFARNGDLDFDLSRYFAGFAIIVSYLYDPDELFKTNIERISKAQFIQGPHRPEVTASLHAAKVFLKPLEKLAIFDSDPVPKLTVPRNEPTGEQGSTPVLALHPGSGSETKNWPEEKWAALIAELLDQTKARLLIVGGEAEGQRLERLATLVPPDRGQLLRNRPLAELASVLVSCDAFVGHDSGITHLAAAVGLPGAVLWANSNETIWHPPSPKFKVLREVSGIRALPVERVKAAVLPLLAK